MPLSTCKSPFAITNLAITSHRHNAGEICCSVAGLPTGTVMVSSLAQGISFPVRHGSTSSDTELFILPLMIALFIFNSLEAF